MTPVYKPRCGIVSQVGADARPGVVGRCASPSTSDGDGRVSGCGYLGSGRARAVGRCRYTTIVNTDAKREATRNDVVNQRFAYPYAITLNTNGLRSSIIARNTLSAFIGCVNRPQVPTTAATVIATS